MAVELNETNFDTEVLAGKIPVLVDFWADWCGPCRMMAPVLEELAEENAGKIKICKVNVDSNPALAQKYGILSIPNFILFKNGSIAGQRAGACPKEELLEFVNS
ncbi:MAG: thioredoxin [Treponema sp.]|nr:thioredoxin [Treponema sp.]